MRLWTIQPVEVVNILENKGVFRACRSKSFWYDKKEHDCFVRCYEWMVDQMKQRIGPPPVKWALPVWSWYWAQGKKQPRPDMRLFSPRTRKADEYRITLDVDEDLVLLSDYQLWHVPLNNGGIRVPYVEDVPELRGKKQEKTWELVFDLDFDDPDYAVPKEKKAIQACTWELRQEWVVKVERFKKAKNK